MATLERLQADHYQASMMIKNPRIHRGFFLSPCLELSDCLAGKGPEFHWLEFNIVRLFVDNLKATE